MAPLSPHSKSQITPLHLTPLLVFPHPAHTLVQRAFLTQLVCLSSVRHLPSRLETQEPAESLLGRAVPQETKLALPTLTTATVRQGDSKEG